MTATNSITQIYTYIEATFDIIKTDFTLSLKVQNCISYVTNYDSVKFRFWINYTGSMN